ncbi:MAG: hypothetical protein WBK55_00710 [Alphaproteobacteria bacterium]
MTNSKLLSDIQEIIRTIPEKIGDDAQWLGRAQSILKSWDPIRGVFHFPSASSLGSPVGPLKQRARVQLTALLHEAENDLQNAQVSQSAQAGIVMPTGKPFDFYNEVRKIIIEAKKEIFFIDPYLDANFAEVYLPHVSGTVVVRLLTGEAYIKELIPSAKMFVKQTGIKTALKKSKDFHDRYVFIDNVRCFQCGGSFKDGAVKAPASLTPVIDAFKTVHDLYEKIWTEAEEQIS